MFDPFTFPAARFAPQLQRLQGLQQMLQGIGVPPQVLQRLSPLFARLSQLPQQAPQAANVPQVAQHVAGIPQQVARQATNIPQQVARQVTDIPQRVAQRFPPQAAPTYGPFNGGPLPQRGADGAPGLRMGTSAPGLQGMPGPRMFGFGNVNQSSNSMGRKRPQRRGFNYRRTQRG